MRPLKEVILQLKEADKKYPTFANRILRKPNYHIFGAQKHQYELLPTLSEPELSKFEQQHQIKLPPDYRQFLQEVCNGRAGPSYGLYTLQEAASVGDPSRPFLLTRDSHLYSDDELQAMGFEDEYLGLLQLCHHGCGMHSYLVVNGPTYGTMWFEDSNFVPTGQSFSIWYRDWAEGELQRLLNEPLANKIKIGMTKAEVIALTGGDWKERIVEATTTTPSQTFFHCPDFRAQLKLDDRGRVIHIRRY